MRTRFMRDEHGHATRRRVLVPDPARAHVVLVIYRWYIGERLGPVPSPPASRPIPTATRHP